MLAVLSPSLNRMMVSFSIFVNLVIVNLHAAAHDVIQNIVSISLGIFFPSLQRGLGFFAGEENGFADPIKHSHVK